MTHFTQAGPSKPFLPPPVPLSSQSDPLLPPPFVQPPLICLFHSKLLDSSNCHARCRIDYRTSGVIARAIVLPWSHSKLDISPNPISKPSPRRDCNANLKAILISTPCKPHTDAPGFAPLYRGWAAKIRIDTHVVLIVFSSIAHSHSCI